MTLEECVEEIFTDVFSGHLSSTKEPVYFIRCPGERLHDRKYPYRKTDCYVRYENPDRPGIWVNCFHDSCKAERMRMTQELRDMKPDGIEVFKKKKRKNLTPEEKEILRGKSAAKGIIASQFPIIFSKLDDSFFSRRLGLEESRERCLSLFEPDEIIWNGEEWESGSRGLGRFATVAQWRVAPVKVFGSYITPWTYPPGETSRSNPLVRKYFVIEFDHLESGDPNDEAVWRMNQIKTWALVHWLAEGYGLKLRLCVDSGKKSLHFWVETRELTPGILALLKGLGACRKVLDNVGQPVRFPGVFRKETHNPQCVIPIG